MKCIATFFLSLLFFSTPSLQAEVQKPKVAVLGGGVGALTSALYLARAGFEPLVIEGKIRGGALSQTHLVQNWPGILEIDGLGLTEKIRDQVKANGAHFLQDEVIAVEFSKKPFVLTLRSLDGKEKERNISVDGCIIAMGATPNFLGVAGETGEDGYWGKGVSNCAVCDGALYRDQIVGVVGGGDAAVVEALYLSKIAKQVHVFVRKSSFKITTDPKQLKAVLDCPNVTIHYNTEIQRIEGDGEKLTQVVAKTPDQTQNFSLDGLFLAIGSKPNSTIFQHALKLDEKGYIQLTQDQKTSVEGVYAIGDIADFHYKQAISAAGDGCKAALQLQEYLLDVGRHDKAALSPPRVKEVSFETKGGVIEIVSQEQFERELQKSEGPVVIDFYASWCGPCRALAPLLEHSAALLAGSVKFLKVNVDQHPKISQAYEIRAMPTVLVFDSGKMIDKKVGTDQIATLLKHLEEENSSQ